jgi:hypothetical protein
MLLPIFVILSARFCGRRCSPPFVVITLGLGIGSSTTIFSLLDGILSQFKPARDAMELPPKTQKPNVVNLSNFVAWRERSHSFQSMAAFLASPMNLLRDRGGEQVPGLSVTADFFETLGTPPLLGRIFHSGEYWTSEPSEVVLRSLLFEINPLDPATLVLVICILLMVSAVACHIPALRATNADPASILREE